MPFNADSNSIQIISPDPSGSAGLALNQNAQQISSLITAANATIAALQAAVASLTTTVGTKAATPSLTAHTAATGTAVHGLGTASTHAHTDYAAAVHTHAASDLTSGTVATARLGSGTADGAHFLCGDQTWSIPSNGLDQPVNTTSSPTFAGLNLGGGTLDMQSGNIVNVYTLKDTNGADFANNPFNQSLNTTDSPNFAGLNMDGGDISGASNITTTNLIVNGEMDGNGAWINSSSVTASAFIGDGSGLTNLPGGGGNPFDQNLNMGDSPTFVNLSITSGNLNLTNGNLNCGDSNDFTAISSGGKHCFFTTGSSPSNSVTDPAGWIPISVDGVNVWLPYYT